MPFTETPVFFSDVPIDHTMRYLPSYTYTLVVVVLLLSIPLLAGCQETPASSRAASDARTEAGRALIEQQLAEAESTVHAMLAEVSDSTTTLSLETLSPRFHEARNAFKSVEFLLAYHYPGVGKKLNGPPLPWIEDYDPNATIIDPEGFQVLEERLFAEETLDRDALVEELKIMAANIKRVRQYNELTIYTDRHAIESFRLGLVRLMALGISGFDSPVVQASLEESALVFEGMEEAIAPYLADVPASLAEEITSLFEANKAYLRSPDHDFITFDRVTYIRDYMNPLSRAFNKLTDEVGAPPAPVPKPFNDWQTIFDADAYNAAFFAPPEAGDATPARVALGKQLFYDPILSQNNQRSCASCHQPDKAFAENKVKSVGFDFQGTTLRNAPTLINAGLQSSSSYDLKTLFVEDRVARVLTNKAEMHTTPEEVVSKLKQSAEYMAQFEAAFGPATSDAVLEQQLYFALSDFVRSLNGMNSAFDKYMRGETDAIDASVKRGFNLFMGKALCGTCHFMPLFTGMVPPAYSEHEAEIIGVPSAPDTVNATVDPDTGKYVLYQYDLHRFSFKTPTVRNAALTAPYMHNGVYETLEEVIDFYNRGGGAGIGIDLEFQTLPPDQLNLTEAEVSDLVSFMESLTDTTYMTSVPSTLPTVIDPETGAPIQRVVGGIY